MAAIIVGDYDASTFVEFNYATYPQLPAGVTYYQLGMGWNVLVPGTVHGQPVVVGDILFAAPRPRLYGDFAYADKLYGTKHVDTVDWLVDEVQFLAWDGNQLPPDQAPYPNAGCPFTPDHGAGGEWAPGWRIVVDCWYDPLPEVRTYGELGYGDQTYGDVERSGPRWVDITQPSFHIEVGDGMQEGGPRVVVSEVVVGFLDPVGVWFDLAQPRTFHQPQPGTAIRVGLLDPTFHYHPLITAEIERIEDVHDNELREVTVRGFGRITDLVVDLPLVKRPAELASARINALAAAAGWRWDSGTIAFPSTGNATLLADADPHDIVARDEIDRSCFSVGWFLDSDRRGRMRVREWPHVPTGAQLQVVDCYGYDDTLVSHSIAYANDQSQLLNYVVTTNAAAPAALSVVAEDVPSSSIFGRRGRAFGFPMTGLAWSATATAQVWAQRVVDRFKFITRQVESFEVDTAVDQNWLATLADMDTGRGVRVTRTAFVPFDLDGVVVGWRWRLDPGRWQGSVFVSTITPSL